MAPASWENRCATTCFKPGLPLTVWNRSRDKTERLANRGATVANSPHDAVTGADVVITMLSDGPTVTDLIFNQGVADSLAERIHPD